MYIVECIDGESELYFYIVQIYRVIIIFYVQALLKCSLTLVDG